MALHPAITIPSTCCCHIFVLSLYCALFTTYELVCAEWGRSRLQAVTIDNNIVTWPVFWTAEIRQS